MRKFYELFKKVNGIQILKQYAGGHVLIYALLMTVLNGLSKKSLEIVRLSVGNKQMKKLRNKYRHFVNDYIASKQQISRTITYNYSSTKHEENNNSKQRCIWFCWFQGLEAAPEIVKHCYASLKKNITDREIVVITEDNYRNYVKFPEYIENKVYAGIISRTHMSDLLRLELLKNYGGTWIDATVYLTGKLPSYMLDDDLFLFQNLKPGLDGHSTCISNWFMTAEVDNNIVNLTLALLYEYWCRNNGLIDYFIFHDFFQIAIEQYPEEWNKVVPVNNSTPHILLLRLFEKYSEEIWDAVKKQTSVHKLTYKFTNEQAEMPSTYYKTLFGEF